MKAVKTTKDRERPLRSLQALCTVSEILSMRSDKDIRSGLVDSDPRDSGPSLYRQEDMLEGDFPK